MLFDRIERELAAGEPWTTNRQEIKTLIGDPWEVKSQKYRRNKPKFFNIKFLHKSSFLS